MAVKERTAQGRENNSELFLSIHKGKVQNGIQYWFPPDEENFMHGAAWRFPSRLTASQLPPQTL